jgi:hypothetical protein
MAAILALIVYIEIFAIFRFMSFKIYGNESEKDRLWIQNYRWAFS